MSCALRYFTVIDQDHVKTGCQIGDRRRRTASELFGSDQGRVASKVPWMTPSCLLAVRIRTAYTTTGAMGIATFTTATSYPDKVNIRSTA
jgi:hypothetical protein